MFSKSIMGVGLFKLPKGLLYIATSSKSKSTLNSSILFSILLPDIFAEVEIMGFLNPSINYFI